MNYSEACDSTVTRAEAIAEVMAHCVSVEEFLEECGNKEMYSGSVVLNWLGY